MTLGFDDCMLLWVECAVRCGAVLCAAVRACVGDVCGCSAVGCVGKQYSDKVGPESGVATQVIQTWHMGPAARGN